MSNANSPRGPVQWEERLPWLILLRAFRPAISLRMLVLAAAGLLLMVAGWRICWKVFARFDDPLIVALADSPSTEIEDTKDGTKVVWPAWPWKTERFSHLGRESFQPKTPVAPEASEAAPSASDIPRRQRIAVIPDWGRDDGLPRSWASATAARVWQITLPFQLIFFGQIGWTGMAFALLCALWSLAVWSLIGGMMTRTVALRLTRDENVTLKQASDFAWRHWWDYFTAPLYPLGIVLLVTLVLMIPLGLVARLDVGAVLVGLFWPLALLGGLLIAVLLLGLFFGWPLMWSTVSVEGNDAFDAIQRAYAYTFQRPLQCLFYGLIAAVLGTLGYLLVQYFADAIILLTNWAVSWGAGNARMNKLADPGFSSGTLIIGFWNGLVQLIASGFAISYLWSATTAIYLLLRRDVDAAEMDEVQLEQEERFGLPPLETDARGVPGAADVPVSTSTATADRSAGDEE